MDHPATAPAYPMPRACPYHPPPGYRELEGGPVSRVTLFDGRPAWLVTGYHAACAALADQRLSVDRARPDFPALAPGFTGGPRFRMFAGMDDPEHMVHRRMVLPRFTVRRVRGMRPAIRRAVDGVLDALLAAGSPGDLVAGFALPVSSSVICELLGVPYAEHGFFQDRTGQRLADDPEVAGRAVRDLLGFLDRVVRDKVADPGDDLISELAAGPLAAGELDRDDLVGMALLLLTAGHETTANTIALGVLALLEHPDQLAALRAEPGLVPRAVDELLRFLSVTDVVTRRVALADLELAGRAIRAGEAVLVATAAANRDPAVFPDPDRLDVRRDGPRHLAFGHGIHLCVGQHLGRTELEIAFAALLRRPPGLRLAAPVADLVLKPAADVQGVRALPVAWDAELT
ncbi:cytochrome P450 [Saccharothrix australiensis]|uniref:Pentalenic acid synthase n=1 Tax=Saccharothrix australiensis TaxID=2072 RepID=A0A495W4E7_9PSEU|nr:cytochrome P450 [Saccharothrix australiensis]RKT55645.1 pentalenic acid synthase [Saccharothrix australiensis]